MLPISLSMNAMLYRDNYKTDSLKLITFRFSELSRRVLENKINEKYKDAGSCHDQASFKKYLN